jgi:lysophospholipase L1-like esterase
MRPVTLIHLALLSTLTSIAVVNAQPPATQPQVQKETDRSFAPQAKSTSSIPRDFKRWEKEIAAYEAADRTNPPPKGGVLFIGSSTIRLWKTLAADFPDHKVINRGFGGSEIADSTHFAERIIFPYEPRQIFLRAGGNDINAGRLPREVAADFWEFVRKVRGKLPKTEILYIEVSPAPQRWSQNDKYRDLNRRIREMALDMPRVAVVDAFDMTLSRDGQARPALFVPDMLHFNELGYRLLAGRVRPYLHHVPEKREQGRSAP